MTRAPHGLALQSGPASAAVYPEVGGRLGELDLGGGPLLRGPAEDLDWAHWGCFPLLPWSNRIPGGLLRFGAIDSLLPVNWEDGSAIHGLAASCPWTVVDQSASTVDLEVDASAGPFQVHGTQQFELEDDRLHLHLAARNDGGEPVPMGLGIHPWFHYGRVRVSADERWPGEPLPTGAPVPVAGEYDLRAGVEPVTMDACFTGLSTADADVPGAVLHWDGPVTNVVVYTGEPGCACVEPVTMANNGFELAREGLPHHGVQVIAPGDTLEVRFQFVRAEGTASA